MSRNLTSYEQETIINFNKEEKIAYIFTYEKTWQKHLEGRLGVKIRLGEEVNPALIEEIKPDVVILATGGIPSAPEISGINRRNVISSSSLHRKAKVFLRFLGPKVLRWLTKFYLPIGKKVVIIGGLIYGCEAAEFLVKRGRKVTITETSDQLGTGILDFDKARLFPWLTEKGATTLTGVRYEEITDKGLTITTKEGERQTIEADTILVTTPPRPNIELFKTIEKRVPEVYLIGDAKEPNLIVDAIADAWSIGHAI